MLNRSEINQWMQDAGWQNSSIRQADFEKVCRVVSAATAPLLKRIAELEQANAEFSQRQEWWNEKMFQLERELEAVRKDAGWQPIETAPRDKTTVALLRLNDDGSFTYGHGYYMPMDGWRCWAHHAYKPPTHWMPLPPPDAAKERT